jgi:hypothetical protein
VNGNSLAREIIWINRSDVFTPFSLPLRVTGIEDFPWEEPYVLGG